MSAQRNIEATLHAFAIWTLSGALLIGLMMFTRMETAFAVRVITAPLIALIVSSAFFSKYEHARPLSVAIIFAGVVALLDAVILAGFIDRSPRLLLEPRATWLPYALILLTTWGSGAVMVVPRVPTSRV